MSYEHPLIIKSGMCRMAINALSSFSVRGHAG